MKPRQNNLNLIRLVLSFAVLFSHSFPISGTTVPKAWFLPKYSLGDIAVWCFFSISGYLITLSYIRRQSFLAFIKARCMRIYPALIVAVTFTVIFFGVFITDIDIYTFIKHPQTIKYWIHNSTLTNTIYSLPACLQNNARPAVNGSLWTLPYELTFYFSVGFVGLLMTNRSPAKTISFLITISIVYFTMNDFSLPEWFLETQFFRLATFFIAGALLTQCKKDILENNMLGFLSLLTSISLCYFGGKAVWALPIPLTLAVFYLAYLKVGNSFSFNKFGDYSYGVYIYAFPVQQCISMWTNYGPYKALLLTVPITFLLAFASWHLIESKSLNTSGNK